MNNKNLRLIDIGDKFSEHLKDNLMKFWLKYSFDTEYGGFYGSIDSLGNPDKSFVKGLVQQAR